MNIETGSSCPLPNRPTLNPMPMPTRPTMPSCPDSSGTMPPCAGLAVPYVPFQQENPNKYAQGEALSNGTLFPGLNLPFHLKVEGGTLPTNPLVELQALEFVVLELGLYLNTHSEDAEAFAMYKQYAAMEKAAKAAYEAKFGPLTKASAATGDRYRWLQGPWPWNFEQNEVK